MFEVIVAVLVLVTLALSVYTFFKLRKLETCQGPANLMSLAEFGALHADIKAFYKDNVVDVLLPKMFNVLNAVYAKLPAEDVAAFKNQAKLVVSRMATNLDSIATKIQAANPEKFAKRGLRSINVKAELADMPWNTRN